MTSPAKEEMEAQNKAYQEEVERLFHTFYPGLAAPLEKYIEWVVGTTENSSDFRARIHVAVQALGTLSGRLLAGLDTLGLPQEVIDSLFKDSVEIGNKDPLLVKRK